MIGVDGDVFNVRRGLGINSPGGRLRALAGRDATRLLAKSAADEADDDGQPLSALELVTLNGWKVCFRQNTFTPAH